MSQLSLTTQLITFEPRLIAAKQIVNEFASMHKKQKHPKHHPNMLTPLGYSTLTIRNNYSMLKPSMPPKKGHSGPKLEQINKVVKGQLYQNINRSSLAKYQAFAEGKLQSQKQLIDQSCLETRDNLVQKDSAIERILSRQNYSPQPLAPHININLQMLIKKRRPSGSQLAKQHRLLLYSSRRK